MNIELNQLLTTSIVKVTFEKVDGTIRVMNCTKNDSIIGEENQPKGALQTVNDSVCRVFDTDIKGWRSFKWDSVREFVASEQQ